MIVPTDIFPRRSGGSVAGLVGFGGAMGGIVSNLSRDECWIWAWDMGWCFRSWACAT